MLVVGLVGGPGAADEARVVARGGAARRDDVADRAATSDEARGVAGDGQPGRGGPPPSARLPLLLHPGHALALEPGADPGSRPRCAAPSRPGRHPRAANDRRRPAPRRLPAAVVAPGPRPRGPAGRGSRSSTPTTTSGSAFGGDWSTPSAGELIATLDAVGRRDARRPRRRPGRRRCRPRSTDGRPRARTGSRCSPGSTTTAGRRPGVRRDRGGPAARFGRARGARAQGLEAARAAGARSGRPTGGRRRRAARPALGRRRRARPAGRHPHRRPDRVLRAARRDERALGGAARAPGLAFLADPPGRRTRRAGLPAVRRAAGRRSGGSSARHPATTFVGAHVGCAAEDLGLVGRLLDAQPEPLRRHRRPARRARPPAVYDAGRSSFATPTGSCSASDMAPDPAIYASTTGSSRRSTSRSTTGPSRSPARAAGRSTDRPAGRRPAQGLSRQRPAGPPARHRTRAAS